MEIDQSDAMQFEDYFPSMMEGLGADDFMDELFQGFQLLMDAEKGFITFGSLRRSTLQLGLQEMGDDELVWMLTEGDLDGDGALSQIDRVLHSHVEIEPPSDGGTQGILDG